MLKTLRRIVQEVNRAGTLHDALEIIVSRIKGALEVDACSVFLNDEQSGELVLLATDGLLPAAVGRVKIPIAEGLVGWVAERAEPIGRGHGEGHVLPLMASGQRCLQDERPALFEDDREIQLDSEEIDGADGRTRTGDLLITKKQGG